MDRDRRDRKDLEADIDVVTALVRERLALAVECGETVRVELQVVKGSVETVRQYRGVDPVLFRRHRG
ncbi:MAG TPA: hypothetical protein VGM37_01320 [Armatimonadota bacterium]|jgi:ribosomal protein L19